MHSATIRVEGIPEIADVIAPEMKEDIERSQSGIRVEGGTAVIEIEAEDSTALRASISSALRYIAAASSAMEAIEDKEE